MFIATLVLFQTMSVFAGPPGPNGGPGRHGGGPGGGPARPPWHGDVVVHRLPAGYCSIVAGGLSFLYCAGLFYKYTPSGYVIVTPPVGAVVPALPVGYTTVVINGVAYYYYSYTYYVLTPEGYIVANPPVATAVQTVPPAVVPAATTTTTTTTTASTARTNQQETKASTAQPAATQSETDTFDIHIPNGDGSFTLVRLKKTEKGFLGPQGEFYPDHPSIDQLKERYVKK